VDVDDDMVAVGENAFDVAVIVGELLAQVHKEGLEPSGPSAARGLCWVKRELMNFAAASKSFLLIAVS
jgi:hypothetical protein